MKVMQASRVLLVLALAPFARVWHTMAFGGARGHRATPRRRGALAAVATLLCVMAVPAPVRAAPSAWLSTGSMATARNYHTATLLPNGTVLVAGGSGAAYLASAEVYDPASGVWKATGSMTTPRAGHTATLLPNGTVLVAGGVGANSVWLDSAELYDPASGVWKATGSMAATRARHTATLLPNGTVLVAGGSGAGPFGAEVYDPASGAWTATGSMATARNTHTATLLPNGAVLVAGGSDNNNLPLASAEVFVPWSETAVLTAVGAAVQLTEGALGSGSP